MAHGAQALHETRPIKGKIQFCPQEICGPVWRQMYMKIQPDVCIMEN